MSPPLWQGSTSVVPTAMPYPKIMPQHLFVPNATWSDAPAIDLPHLKMLWQAWSQVATQHAPTDWASPIERLYAEALGIDTPDREAPLPFAALADPAGKKDEPCAWVRPIQVMSGMNEIMVEALPPKSLSAAEADALVSAMAPLCKEDGMTLLAIEPERWLLKGERLRGITTPSLARARNQHLAPYVPFVSAQIAGQVPAAADNLRWLLRLQNEVQMLYYTHPLNDERAAKRLPSVSGIWIEGAGHLSEPPRRSVEAIWLPNLSDTAGAHVDWVQAWQDMDRNQLRPIYAGGSPDDRITFGNSDSAVTWKRCATGLAAKINRPRRQWGLQKMPTLPNALLNGA